MAHISTDILTHPFGFDISVQGLNDSLEKWMKEIIEKLISFDPITEERKFQMIHETVQKSFKNFDKNKPYIISIDNVQPATRDIGYYENAECLKIISEMSFAEFVNLSKDWLKSVRFEWLAGGNLESSSIKELVCYTEEKFKDKNSLKKEDSTQIRLVKLKKNDHFFYDYHISDLDQNNSDVLIQYHDKRHPKSRIMCLLLENYLNAPFFEELRTNQQIGYIVFVFYREFRGICSLNFQIQSERFPSHENSMKIFKFIDSMKIKLNSLDDNEFFTYKNSVLNQITQKDLDIYKEIENYSYELIFHEFLFDRKEKESEIVNNLKKEEFIAFCNRFLWEEPRILEFHTICENHRNESKKLKEERKAKNTNLKEIQNLKIFKSQMSFHPDFFSYFQGNI